MSGLCHCPARDNATIRLAVEIFRERPAETVIQFGTRQPLARERFGWWEGWVWLMAERSSGPQREIRLHARQVTMPQVAILAASGAQLYPQPTSDIFTTSARFIDQRWRIGFRARPASSAVAKFIAMMIVKTGIHDLNASCM